MCGIGSFCVLHWEITQLKQHENFVHKKEENLVPKDLMQFIDPSGLTACAPKSLSFDSLDSFTVDPGTDELVITFHASKTVKSLNESTNAQKVEALPVMGSKAQFSGLDQSPIFSMESTLFSLKCLLLRTSKPLS